MEQGIYAVIPQDRLNDMLQALHGFTGVAIRLVNSGGETLAAWGETPRYCLLMHRHVAGEAACSEAYGTAGERASEIGEAYVFTCHANLTHIAFPLISRDALLGSVVIGPFLMDRPDSTLVSELAERHALPLALVLELYDESAGIPVMTPEKAQQLKKLVDHLFSPLISSERALLLQSREKAYQQARINETIQLYKGQEASPSRSFFFEKERELLTKVRTGSVSEVKRLLNELIGYALFSEGGKIEAVRVHAVELTTLLSRVAIEGGAQADTMYQLNGKFLSMLYQEQDIEELCHHLQDVLESFMTAMFRDTDKGNPYIRKALRCMADRYNEHLELSTVAREVQLSEGYFSNLFRQVVGVSFREQLCRIRVEESKRLLLSTDYSLSDIAVAVGFPDQSYYCKVFKRIVGVTPGRFRS